MKLHQENCGFSPIAVVLESREEVTVFWRMMGYIKQETRKDDEYKMSIEISDWLSNEAHI